MSDERFERLEERFDRLEARFDRLEAMVANLISMVGSLSAQFAKLDAKVEELAADLAETNTKVDNLSEEVTTIKIAVFENTVRLDKVEIHLARLVNMAEHHGELIQEHDKLPAVAQSQELEKKSS